MCIRKSVKLKSGKGSTHTANAATDFAVSHPPIKYLQWLL